MDLASKLRAAASFPFPADPAARWLGLAVDLTELAVLVCDDPSGVECHRVDLARHGATWQSGRKLVRF